MSDQLETYLKEQGGRGSVLSLDRKKYIDIGRGGPKGTAEVSLHHNQRTRPVGKMFFKEGPEMEREWITYLELKKIFKEALSSGEIKQIPLVNTLRISNGKMIRTDVTEGDKKILIDRHFLKNKDIGMIPKEFKLSNAEELAEEIKKIESVVARKGIFMPYDAYGVIADRETGIGTVCLADLNYFKRFSEMNGTEEYFKRLARHEAEDFGSFLRRLDTFKDDDD